MLLAVIFAPQETAWAQNSSDGDPPGSGRRVEIDESPLDTVYLRREDGTFVPYFDIPFEVFEKLYEQYVGGQGDVLPESFTIQRLALTGKVDRVDERQIADLQLVLRILPHRDGWVRVPLRLANSTLTGWEKGRPEDTTLVSIDDDGEYLAWVQGIENQPVDLTLKLVTRVTRQSNQHALRLSLPTAAVSDLSVDLPTDQPGITVSSEKLLPQTEVLPEGRTMFSVSGASGDVEIRWREAVALASSGLSVTSDMTIHVDGPDLIRYQVALDVTSLNGQDRSFLLRMPSGTRFDATEQLDLEVIELDPTDSLLDNLAGDFAYLQVNFPKPIDKPTKVVIFASRSGLSMESSDVSQRMELGRFEVVDAVRQSGTILLLAARDWRLDWRPGSFVRQVSFLATDRERETALARFQFSRSPIELSARIYRNETRIACEPIYEVLFGNAQLQLNAELNFVFSGPRPEFLMFEPRGWSIDETQLTGNRSVRGLSKDADDENTYRLELDPAAPSDSLQLSLELTRPLDALGSTTVPLPLPRVSTLSPALVRLRTIENLEILRPIETESGPLQPIDSVEPTSDSDASVQVRVPSLEESSQLTCVVQQRQQKQSLSSSLNVRWLETAWDIQQRFEYEVRFSPLERIYMMVDRSVLESGELSFELDEQLLRYQPVASSFSSLDRTLQLIELSLPQPLIGRFQIDAAFRLQRASVVAGTDTEALRIPTLVPVQRLDTTLLPIGNVFIGPFGDLNVLPLGDLAQEIALSLPISMSVVSYDDRWQLEELGQSVDRSQYRLAKLDQEPVFGIDVTVSTTQDRIAPRASRMEVWVQSLMTPRYRRDRVTMKVETPQKRVEVELPAFAQLFQLAVDGVLQPDASSRVVGQTLSVEFAEDLALTEHTLELWYRFPNDRLYQRWIDFEIPELEMATWVDQLYWEIVLPPDEFMLVGPQSLVAENRSQWRGLLYTEQASVSATWLEEWIGVEHQRQGTERYQRYLYTGFGESIDGRVWVGKRWEILAVICGGVFLIGMMLVYFPMLRRPVPLLLIGCIAIGVGLSVQPAGQMLIQLTLATSVFVLVGFCLRWILSQPSRRFVARAMSREERSNHSRAPIGDDATTSQRPMTPDVSSTQAAGEGAS